MVETQGRRDPAHRLSSQEYRHKRSGFAEADDSRCGKRFAQHMSDLAHLFPQQVAFGAADDLNGLQGCRALRRGDSIRKRVRWCVGPQVLADGCRRCGREPTICREYLGEAADDQIDFAQEALKPHGPGAARPDQRKQFCRGELFLRFLEFTLATDEGRELCGDIIGCRSNGIQWWEISL